MPSLRSRVHSSVGALFLALSIGSAVAPNASATPVFPVAPDSPFTLTGPGVTSFYDPAPALAVNAGGASVAAWTVSKERATKFVAGRAQLEVSFRAAGAPADAWSAPIVVSETERIAGSPQVGIDARGVATIAWTESTDSDSVPGRVRVATAAGGVLGPVQGLVSSSGPLVDVSLAVAPTGAAILAYTEWRRSGSGGPESDVIVARRAATAAAFSVSDRALFPGSDGRAWYPAVQTNAAGFVAVAWVEQPVGGETSHVKLMKAAPGEDFGPKRNVSGWRDLPVSEPALTVDPTGAVTVGWTENRATPSQLEPAGWAIVLRRLEVDEILGLPQTVASAGGGVGVPVQSRLQLASDAAGQVTAAWTIPSREFEGKDTVQVATAPAGADFRAPVTLITFASSPELSLAVESSGATAVAYGGAGQVLGVHWRAAGAANFIGLGKVSDRWAQPVSIAFGRGPDELTLLFGTDYAPVFVVQTVTTVPAPPTPTPLPAVPTPSPAPAPTPVVDRVAPVVTIGAVTKVPGAKPKKGKKRKATLTVTVSASETAQVSAALSRQRPGVRKGSRCVARPSDPKQRAGRRSCVRTLAVGTPETATVGAEGRTLDFGTAPAAGTYTVTVKATDAAGNVATPATKRFTIR